MELIVDYLPLQLETLYAEAIELFNQKPSKAIQFLINQYVIEGAPDEVADFIFSQQKLSKRIMGEYLGGSDIYNQSVTEVLFDMFPFNGLSLDEGIRYFAKRIRLPGEAQKIDRLVEKFATSYHKQNPRTKLSVDTLYILAFSIIMLNTDLHNPSIPKHKKMTLAQFITNNQRIDRNITVTFCTEIYHKIKKEAITMNEEDMFESTQMSFIGPAKAGWLHKNVKGILSRSLKRWFVLKDSCLYYFLNPNEMKTPRCILPLDGVEVIRLSAREIVLVGRGMNKKIKAGKFIASGSGGSIRPESRDPLVLKAASESDCYDWFIHLKSESEPIHEVLRKSISNVAISSDKGGDREKDDCSSIASGNSSNLNNKNTSSRTIPSANNNNKNNNNSVISSGLPMRRIPSPQNSFKTAPNMINKNNNSSISNSMSAINSNNYTNQAANYINNGIANSGSSGDIGVLTKSTSALIKGTTISNIVSGNANNNNNSSSGSSNNNEPHSPVKTVLFTADTATALAVTNVRISSLLRNNNNASSSLSQDQQQQQSVVGNKSTKPKLTTSFSSRSVGRISEHEANDNDSDIDDEDDDENNDDDLKRQPFIAPLTLNLPSYESPTKSARFNNNNNNNNNNHDNSNNNSRVNSVKELLAGTTTATPKTPKSISDKGRKAKAKEISSRLQQLSSRVGGGVVILPQQQQPSSHSSSSSSSTDNINKICDKYDSIDNNFNNNDNSDTNALLSKTINSSNKGITTTLASTGNVSPFTVYTSSVDTTATAANVNTSSSSSSFNETDANNNKSVYNSTATATDKNSTFNDDDFIPIVSAPLNVPLLPVSAKSNSNNSSSFKLISANSSGKNKSNNSINNILYTNNGSISPQRYITNNNNNNLNKLPLSNRNSARLFASSPLSFDYGNHSTTNSSIGAGDGNNDDDNSSTDGGETGTGTDTDDQPNTITSSTNTSTKLFSLLDGHNNNNNSKNTANKYKNNSYDKSSSSEHEGSTNINGNNEYSEQGTSTETNSNATSTNNLPSSSKDNFTNNSNKLKSLLSSKSEMSSNLGSNNNLSYVDGRANLLMKTYSRNAAMNISPSTKEIGQFVITDPLHLSLSTTPLIEGWMFIRDYTNNFRYRNTEEWVLRYCILIEGFDNYGPVLFYFPTIERALKMKHEGLQTQLRYILLNSLDCLCINKVYTSEYPTENITAIASLSTNVINSNGGNKTKVSPRQSQPSVSEKHQSFSLQAVYNSNSTNSINNSSNEKNNNTTSNSNIDSNNNTQKPLIPDDNNVKVKKERSIDMSVSSSSGSGTNNNTVHRDDTNSPSHFQQVSPLFIQQQLNHDDNNIDETQQQQQSLTSSSLSSAFTYAPIPSISSSSTTKRDEYKSPIQATVDVKERIENNVMLSKANINNPDDTKVTMNNDNTNKPPIMKANVVSNKYSNITNNNDTDDNNIYIEEQLWKRIDPNSNTYNGRNTARRRDSRGDNNMTARSSSLSNNGANNLTARPFLMNITTNNSSNGSSVTWRKYENSTTMDRKVYPIRSIQPSLQLQQQQPQQKTTLVSSLSISSSSSTSSSSSSYASVSHTPYSLSPATIPPLSSKISDNNNTHNSLYHSLQSSYNATATTLIQGGTAGTCQIRMKSIIGNNNNTSGGGGNSKHQHHYDVFLSHPDLQVLLDWFNTLKLHSIDNSVVSS